MFPAIAIAAQVGVVAYALNESDQSRAAEQRHQEALLTLSAMYRSIVDAETGVRGYFITGRPEFLAPYDAAVVAFPAEAAALTRQFDQRPDDRAEVVEVAELFEEWQLDFARPVIAARANGDSDTGFALLDGGAGKRVLDRLRDSLDSLTTAEQSALASSERSSNSLERNALIVGGAMPILALILTATPLLFVSSKAVNRLLELRRATDRAAAGDYSARTAIKSRDEIQDVAEAFNSLAANLEAARATELALQTGLERRSAEAEAAASELEAFSYSVAHDLRAPLRTIHGFSEFLREDYAASLDDQARDYIERICAGTQRMEELIDGLLALSRVSRQVMEWEPVNLSDIAREIAGQMRAAEPGRLVEIGIEPGLTVQGHPVLLRQVLDNLLRNSWKYSAKVEDARITFSASEGDGHTVFHVRDNGSGFDMRYAGKLFAPFQRLHDSSEFAGTGLGLATVARIVRRHGGDIWAHAEPGKGATFSFRLTGGPHRPEQP